MLTRDRLAKALREADLPSLARQAERGDFDALEHKTDKVYRALFRTLRALRFTSPKADQLSWRVANGEFYNTEAEIRKWIADHPEVTK